MSKLTISHEVLALLRCPRSKQALHLADDAELERVRNQLKRLQPDSALWEGALVTESGSTAYPIDDGYPILLVDRALQLTVQ